VIPLCFLFYFTQIVFFLDAFLAAVMAMMNTLVRSQRARTQEGIGLF
jgi:hypothetical protein